VFGHTKLGITILVLIIFLACIARASRPVGDIDGNFRVDINDLELLADQWLGDPNGSANINGDDRINMADFCLLANNWGKGTPVYISEFMANKGSSLSTEVEPVRHPGMWEEIKPDWIEIYNNSNETQNLDGWYLTDNKNNLTKWRVPSISIGSGQYKVICVSGKQQKYYSYNYPYFDGTYYHTNFELNRGGEYLALVRPDGVTVADEYAPEYPNQRGFVSYGYCSDTGGYGYFVDPTWGAANSSTCVTDIVADTKFSHDRGFYDDAFDVTISTTTLDATIRYTTDGSTPTETHGNIYSSPVHISTTTCLRAMAYKSGYLPTNVDTQTYIFLEDVLVQDGDGFPDTWGHFDPCDPENSDYGMVPYVVSLYDNTIRDDLKAIPTMSLVMSVDEWFNGYEWPDHGGIYANPQWEDIYDEWAERVVSVELFDPCGTLGEFQINAVVRICGGTSTEDWKTDKLSMRLKFQEPYGPTKLNYPIFGDEVADSFDTLILDARPNNSWLISSGKDGHGVQNIHAQYTRDQFVADLHNAMADGNYSPHGRKVHLYLNGLYWGLYWVHERPDHSSAASYCGGDKDDYDCLKHAPGTVVHGTNTNYGEMFGIVGSTPVSYENYQLIQQYLDLPDFIDYIQTNVYAGNHDWPDSPYGNWYATRNVIDPAGRWRYHSWDAEHVVEDVSRMCLMSCDITYGSPLDLHDKLSTNTEYRMLFADHAHKHLFNDGVLTPENAAAMYQVRLDEIDRAIVGESARWGDNRFYEFKTIFTRDVNWVSERDRLLNTYFPYRTDNVIVELWYFGLYPDVDAPIFTPHSGWDMTDFTVTMTNPNSSGTIWYTTDGNDPRLPVILSGDTVLVAENAEKRVLIPSGYVSNDWKGGAPFDDSSWNDATFIDGMIGGVGFDWEYDYEQYISYDVLNTMYGYNNTCYIRVPFSFYENPGDFNSMILKMRYDDGFIAYLNGVKIAESHAPASPQWYSNATTWHGDAQVLYFENFVVSEHIGDLISGDNILAIHGLNYYDDDHDFLISVELVVDESDNNTVSPAAMEYTPGSNINITETTQLKARVQDTGIWSALNEAIYAVGPVVDNLRITEIMYHPQDTNEPNDPNEEFIELMNIGTESINLNFVSFTRGIYFTFPDSKTPTTRLFIISDTKTAGTMLLMGRAFH